MVAILHHHLSTRVTLCARAHGVLVGDVVRVVIAATKEVSSDGGQVVRLRRVGQSVVLGHEDAALGKGTEFCLLSRQCVLYGVAEYTC